MANSILTHQGQRVFLDSLAKSLNLKSHADWGKVNSKTIIENNGARVLQLYGGSLQKTLKSVYSDVDWKNEWFISKQKNFWNHNSQREFLDNLAKKLNIKKPSDWGSVTKRQVLQHNGSYIIYLHNGSFQNALKTIYPEISWKPEWFQFYQRGWKKKNQRQMMESIAKRLNIKSPSEWGKITTKMVYIIPEGRKVLQMHGSSIRKALKSVFPEIEWKREWFLYKQKNFWDKSNQREYLDELAKKLKIKEHSAWGSIPTRTIIQYNGRRLLQIYGGSLQRALKEIYSEIKWNSEWFKNTRIQLNTIESEREFLLNIARKFALRENQDWRKVTHSMLLKNGGKSIIRKYLGSIQFALKSVFPEQNWDFISNNFLKTETFLVQSLQELFKDHEVKPRCLIRTLGKQKTTV